jgi:hypothetical protein
VDSASFAAVVGDTLTVLLSSSLPQGLTSWVRVNGVRIFETGAGRTLPASMTVLAREQNTIEVWMGGKPGSTVRIVVTTSRPATPPPTYAMTVISGSSVIGSSDASTFTLTEGERFHYSFRPAPGFTLLTVLLDGQPVADSGSVLMNQPHWLAVSADTVVTLDAREADLARLLRSTLNSATPRESWVTFQQSVRTQSATWGTESERHMARVFFATIDPSADLPALVRLDSAVAGLVEEVPIPGSGTLVSSRAAMRASQRSVLASAIESAAPEREPMLVLAVNGILNTASDVLRVSDLIAQRLSTDPLRFPRGSVTVSHFWNSTLATTDALGRTARVCSFLVSVQASVRGFSFVGRGAAGIRDMLSLLMACVARSDVRNIDLIEAIRWIQQAQAGTPQREFDIDNLTRFIKSHLAAPSHVVVLPHSEGSVLTQLATLRLKSDYAFNETTSPYCVSTISVAGAGTANWPLSDRHSRFVVAKNDFVTLLPSPWGNTRPTFEDVDTRAADSLLASLQQNAIAHPSVETVSLLMAARVAAAKEIHSFLRYINRDEDWQIISGHLDDLYRTCAIGRVTVEPTSRTLQVFGSGDFSARWAALDGLPLPTADAVTWTTDPSLATVSPTGRVTAGTTVGVAPLVAQVRRTTGSASVTIADDSLVATYVPPTIDSIVTRRAFFAPLFGLPGPTALVWYMKISARAMPGATIANVEVRRRINGEPYTEGVVYSGPLPDDEFVYQGLPYNADGTPAPNAYDMFATHDYSWYRVIITDSHGLKTEFIGASADPFMIL